VAWLWASSGQRRTCELAITRPDGSRFLPSSKAWPWRPRPKPGSWPPAALLDITARRQVADTLAASEARFRATFEQSRDGILLLDNHRFVDVNDAGVWMLRRADRGQVVGHQLAEFWPEH
jgi:PAS domain-containing protein